VVPLLEADGVPLNVGRRTRVIHTATNPFEVTVFQSAP
jgi:hypothetical protein